MTRYVAFLRGVSPMNANMASLKKCFDSAGLTNIRTVLASGNVVFNHRSTSIEKLQKKIEDAMTANLDRSFSTIVRSVDDLKKLLDGDPYAGFKLPKTAKKVITFLREPASEVSKLPIKRDDVFILSMCDTEVISAYVPGPKGPVFMQLLEKTFGKDITTRTVDTVKKCISV